MGKVKAWAMDLEEEFYDAVSAKIGGCECLDELFEVMRPKMHLVSHKDKTEVDCILQEMWYEFWSDYA